MPGPSNQLAEGFSTAIGDGGSVLPSGWIHLAAFTA
jgi:hypothetical protein